MRRQQNITRTEPLQLDAEHYRRLYTCFSLFGVLYLPDPGLDNVPIGDDLMEWHIENTKGKAYWGCTDDEDMDISDQLTDVHRS